MKFSFKHSVTVIIVCIFILLLSAFSATVNVINLIKLKDLSFYNSFSRFLMLFVSVILIFFGASVLFFSYYKISDEKLTLNIGVIKITYLLKNVKSLTLFDKQKKLVLYLKDDSYSVIVIKENKFNEFVKSVTEKDKNIPFNYIGIDSEK